MNELTPQAKIEHIIFLVREYEADITKQQQSIDDAIEIHTMQTSLCLSMGSTIETDTIKHEPMPSIQPKAQVYLERIEAFLENR